MEFSSMSEIALISAEKSRLESSGKKRENSAQGAQFG
jgi:CBS domain containing-hemolysin-like protein